MKILVNGHDAVLKAGSSFEYISENRLFLGRDGYTLSISFPLNDCPQNLEIFGHINRMDVDKEKLTFECAILDSFISIFGTLTVVGVYDKEIKCQFTEGRCEQTANDPFFDTYINELDLGSYPELLAKNITPSEAWKGYDNNADAVALPWINNEYPTVPNNWVTYDGTTYAWKIGVTKLSWQPYLLSIAKKICEVTGYDYDFSKWEESGYRYLIICNTLPASWDRPSFAEALPHWTVSEFFEKLELLIKCEFDFDHRSKSVRFSFTREVLDDLPPVELKEVVDEYSAEISHKDSNCEYIAAKRLAYKNCGHEMSNFYACDWIFRDYSYVREYENVQTMINANQRLDIERTTSLGYAPITLWGEKIITDYSHKSVMHSLMYAKQEKTFFTMRSIGTEFRYKDSFNKDHYTQIYVLQPINVFGSGTTEDVDSSTEEIEFCPVCISDTYVSPDDDMGYIMFLSCGSMQETSDYTAEEYRDESTMKQSYIVNRIIEGEKSNGSDYYDVIYVAFWDGAKPQEGAQPYPYIDPVTVRQDWVKVSPHIPDLRIYGSSESLVEQLPKIDKKKKFKFSWISNEIPNPRAIFHIRGKRYLCEKITATFTEDGMSQLLKGEFYPLAD